MNVFSRRPFAAACALLALTVVLSGRIGGVGRVILLCLSLAALLASLVLRCRKRNRVRVLLLLLSVAVFLGAAASHAFYDLRYAKDRELIGKRITVTGYVTERGVSVPYAGSLFVRVGSVDGCPADIRAVVECSYPPSLQAGECFSMTVTARGFENDAGYGEEAQRLSDGYTLALVLESAEDCTVSDRRVNTPELFFKTLNADLSQKLRDAVGGREGALAAALLLGNRSFLSDDTTVAFRRAGVSHLLALSGLHVSILIGFLEWILQKMRMPKPLRAVLLPLFALGYLALTGFAPSTCRAVLMLCTLYAGFFVRAEYDSVTSLFGVLALILLATPYSAGDLSLWMSFLAAGSILVFLPLFDRLLSGRAAGKSAARLLSDGARKVLAAVLVGVITNVAMLPVLAYGFGVLSLWSIPATLVLYLPIMLIIVLSVVGVPFPAAGRLCALPCRFVYWFVDQISATDGALLPVSSIPVKVLCAVLAVSVAVLAVCRVRKKLLFLLPVALSAAVCVTAVGVRAVQRRETALTCLHVSGGEVLLFTQNGNAVAVDFSDGSASAAVALTDAAGAEECTEIGDLVLNHYHNKDSYLLASLSSRMRVVHLHLPEPADENERAIAARLEEEAEYHGIRVTYGTDGLCIQSLDLRASLREPMSGGRHDAVVFHAAVGDWAVTYFNASAPDSGLSALLDGYAGASDVWVIGAAGNSVGSTALFPTGTERTKVIVLPEKALSRRLSGTDPGTEVISGAASYRYLPE